MNATLNQPQLSTIFIFFAGKRQIRGPEEQLFFKSTYYCLPLAGTIFLTIRFNWIVHNL